MAVRMKHWVAIVVAACTVVALLTIPRRESETVASPTPAQAEYQSISAELAGTHRALQAMRWVDSLSALAVRDAVDGLALGFPEDGQGVPGGLEGWRRAITVQLEALGSRDDGVVIGFYRQRYGQGAAPGVPLSRLVDETFVGSREGTPFCLRVFDSIFRLSRIDLAACRYFAKYGMAGPGVLEWLRSGNAGHAVGVRTGRSVPSLFRFREPRFGINRTLLGSRYMSLSALRCVAGDADACAAAISGYGEGRAAGSSRETYEVANAPGAWLLDWGTGLPNGRTLLSDLEREFGEEAFSRFWTSEAPLSEAFQATFGLSLGDWALGWVDADMGLERAGPGLSFGSLVLSLLAVAVLAGSAVSTQVARRIA